MDVKKFYDSLQNGGLPIGLSLCQQALWHDAKGNWEEAHRLIQDEQGNMPGRIHAYLHRKEGDNANAGYWYRRAGAAPFAGTLQAEWDALVLAAFSQQ